MASDLGTRVLVSIALLALLAIGYGAFGLAGLAPLPRSIASLAAEQRVGRGQAIVIGLYEVQPFVANGNGLPPYALKDKGGSKIHVSPTLADLKAVPVVVSVDLATGDGTEWNPYAVHTIGSTVFAAAGASIGVIVLCALVLWLAGPIALALGRLRAKGPQRAT